MKLAWKNLTKDTPEKAADFKEAWADSENFRLFLKELLQERMEAEMAIAMKEDYDCPNWNLKQADAIGTVRTYRKIMELLDN
jgi:2-keto-4-pentenoate hydratase